MIRLELGALISLLRKMGTCVSVLSALGFWVLASPVWADSELKRVLAIGSYAEDVPFQLGFMEGFAEGLGEDVVLYREYLSYPAFSGAEHESNFERYLREKYTQQIDLIVLFDDGAIQWGKTYTSFRPEAQRLNLVERWKLAGDDLESDLAQYMVFPELNFLKMLKLIEAIDPGAPISVVYDEQSEVSIVHRKTLEAAAESLGLEDRITFLGGEIVAIRERCQDLPAGSPVVFLPLFRGENGAPINPTNAVRYLVRDSGLKFYTMWDTLMVKGVLGGEMLISKEVGKAVADQSHLILKGEPLDWMNRDKEGLYAFVFDDELRRGFEIEASILPEGSVLVNERPTFFKLYFWQSLMVLLLFLVLFIVMVSLRLLVKQRTRELVLRNDELNTILKQKNRLTDIGRGMTMLAHDLRSPICTIKTCSQLLSESSKSGFDPKMLINQMSESSDKSLSMISDMLDYVRTLEPKIEKLPAREFLVSLQHEIDQILAEVKTAPVECTLLGYGDVNLDTVKISRVVANLVKNALESLGKTKTSDPKVLVHVEVSSEDIAITVSDNGPGVDKEIAEDLFEPFHTAGKKTGIGLGLAIAKEFVEAHGGQIKFDTAPGETVFRIDLPNLRGGVETRVIR